MRRKRVGRLGSSTSWFITTARISERKISVIEKHIPIAAHRMLIGFLDKYARKCERLTLYRALQPDFLLRLVKKHHKLGGRQELALPHARQVGRDLAESLWRDRDDGAED